MSARKQSRPWWSLWNVFCGKNTYTYKTVHPFRSSCSDPTSDWLKWTFRKSLLISLHFLKMLVFMLLTGIINFKCHFKTFEEWSYSQQQCAYCWEKGKKVKSLSRVWLFATPWTVACQVLPSMAFSRQEYWSGLPFPSPGDLPNPGIEPGCPTL